MLSHVARKFGASGPLTFHKAFSTQLSKRFFGGAVKKHGGKDDHASHGKHDVDKHGHDDHGHDDHHHDERHHLNEDGTRNQQWTSDRFHMVDPLETIPKFQYKTVNGQRYLQGEETIDVGKVHGIPQVYLPFWARQKINIWGNYPLICKAEFLFFYIPTAIIFSLVVPSFCMLYMVDEAIYTTMTVKVIGRQWYWVYEIEAPSEDEE